jgi:hypothetical protein
VSPGTPLFGLLLPLNWDALTTLVFTHPGLAGQGFAGVLDAQGKATAELDPSGMPLSDWVGLSAHHAFLAGQGLTPTLASNPVLLEFGP